MGKHRMPDDDDRAQHRADATSDRRHWWQHFELFTHETPLHNNREGEK